MTAEKLIIDKSLELVAPDVERDARVSLSWLKGASGRETMQLMGRPAEKTAATNIEYEKKRIQSFIDSTNQQTWMIRHEGSIVGSIWIYMDDKEHLPGPSMHIMIGEATARGHGIGTKASQKVLEYIKSKGVHKFLYSRYLVSNHTAAALLEKLGFEPSGEKYEDKDGLVWQNVSLQLA